MPLYNIHSVLNTAAINQRLIVLKKYPNITGLHQLNAKNKCLLNHCRLSSDTIWRHKSVLKFAQIMTCCLAAPIPFPNPCWLIIKHVLWHLYPITISKEVLKISLCKSSMKSTYPPHLPGANELTHCYLLTYQSIDEFGQEKMIQLLGCCTWRAFQKHL